MIAIVAVVVVIPGVFPGPIFATKGSMVPAIFDEYWILYR